MEKAAPSDAELLADWLGHHRELAFHALVVRYAGLVHMAAKRTSGDETVATEASQITFILLARKAKSLDSRSSLAGWLHLTAVMQAKNLVRQNRREKHKRQLLQSAMDAESHSHSGDAWTDMQPVLDDALAALSDKDREALLLRFYRSLSIREIAATLGIATDAAQKRIDRATERLRGKLARRGCQVGGSLGAAMVAGFAADAQAVVLPVSAIATKAIAAGTASSFGLAATITSIAALMKSSSLIPPVVALILAGAWTGTKYFSLTAAEARNEVVRQKIAQTNTAKTAAPVKVTKDDGPIDWEKLAAEKGKNGPETKRFWRRLESMTREEMIATLDQIAALELSRTRRTELESSVILPLMQIDPEWVLNRFTDRLREVGNQALPLSSAFALWAQRDPDKATTWLDARIAAGNLNSKRLDDAGGQQPRNAFESALVGVLLGADPAAAIRRVGALPENQREPVISSLTNRMGNHVLNQPLTEGNHLAFANLVRSQMPPNRQAPILSRCMPSSIWGVEEFPRFNAYMDVIEATPEERIACAEDFAGNSIRMLLNRRKVTLDDLEALRGEFAKISPQSVDVMTARSLEMVARGTTAFANVSELAVELQETSGSDAVLATLLEVTDANQGNKELCRKLAGKISDEKRRAEILKRFN